MHSPTASLTGGERVPIGATTTVRESSASWMAQVPVTVSRSTTRMDAFTFLLLRRMPTATSAASVHQNIGCPYHAFHTSGNPYWTSPKMRMKSARTKNKELPSAAPYLGSLSRSVVQKPARNPPTTFRSAKRMTTTRTAPTMPYETMLLGIVVLLFVHRVLDARRLFLAERADDGMAKADQTRDGFGAKKDGLPALVLGHRPGGFRLERDHRPHANVLGHPLEA